MSLVSGYIRNPYHQSPDDFSLLYRHHPHPPSMFAAAAAHHPSNDAMLGETSAAGAYFQTWMLQQQQRSHSPSTGSNSCSLTPEYPSAQDQRYSRFLHGSSDVTSDLYSHPGSFVDYAGFSNMLSAVGHASDGAVPVRVRCVKRRSSANKKERRRTHSINSAFSALRGCIPNVPSDTKLSKIKTLRLATSYISYMMEVLSNDDPKMQLDALRGGFKADISKKQENREERRRRETEEIRKVSPSSLLADRSHDVKPKGSRTGWPQQVWAAELKTEQP